MFHGIRYLFRLVYRLEKKYIVTLLLAELFQTLLVLLEFLDLRQKQTGISMLTGLQVSFRSPP